MTHAGPGQGSNSANLRHFNERVVLTALRRLGQASKADLARAAKLTDNTVGLIVRELQARGLIRVEGKRSGGRGQPATLLSLDPEGAYAIGVKIGRRTLDGVLVDFCGRVVADRRVEREFPPPAEALATARAVVAALSAELPAGWGERICGLGLAMPYNMGSWRRELDIAVSGYEAWEGFDLAARLEEATGLRVYPENDGTAAAVAELFLGQGHEHDSFLYTFIGTAIGGGIVLSGDCFRGAHGNAGDIGLMPVAPSRLDSAPQPSRTHDLLLNRASIGSLIRHLRNHGTAIASRADLEAAITTARSPRLGEWLDDCTDALVAPLLTSARLLDFDTIVLDADLPVGVIDELMALLEARLQAASPEARDAPRLRQGLIGRAAAAIGAAILPLHHGFSPSPDILVGAESPRDIQWLQA